MEELVHDFQRYLAGQGISYRSRSAYAADIRRCLHSLPAEARAAQALATLSVQALQKTVESGAPWSLSEATRRRTRSSLSRFVRFLRDHQAGRSIPRPNSGGSLTDANILALFRYLRLQSRAVSPRKSRSDELLLLLMLFTGLRLSECVHLGVDSFEGAGTELRIKRSGALIDGPVLGHLNSFRRRYASDGSPLFGGLRNTRRLLGDISGALGFTVDPGVLHRTHRRLRDDPELANRLLARIEDIHE